jgi:hypothetical protein
MSIHSMQKLAIELAGKRELDLALFLPKPLFDVCFRSEALRQEATMRDKPIDLLHKTIRCRDGPSGHTTEYTVVDGGTSVVSGDYFVLEDVQGVKRPVSADELHDMRVD